MATVGGLLASAIVKVAIDKLGSFIAERANLVWNVKNHMEDMKDTLETMAATLQDAEKQSVKDAEVGLWLKRLKSAAYDISDMLDEFQEETTQQQMTGILPVAIRKNSQATKMKRMRERLMKIQVQHTSFKFKQSTIAIIDQKQYDPRETISDVNGSDIIGRDAEKLELTDLLTAHRDKDRTMILPIYGLGGIGKSTLAGLVYNDMQFKGYDHRIWVYVSQVFNLKEIGKSLILQLQTGCQQNTDTLQLINRCLNDLLSGKKVLVVLDDIWEEDDSELDRLKTMLCKNGSTIDVIVTTRSEAIARNICTHKPYQLQPLKDDICWDIIKKKSQFENKSSKDQMEQIGLSIAKKCGGVALAAQALGYMLKSKDLHGWSEVNDSDVWKNPFEDDNLPYNKVLPSLRLSFESMPPNLRLSFSYCAIFPKGHDIVEDDLIHQWIALDFVTPSKGKEYMKQLFGMSFLQHSKLPSTSGKGVVRYTMHNLVHDLARSVIGDELIEIDTATKSNMSGQKFCRYALLKNYDGQTKLSNIFPQQVRALHVSSSSKLDLHGSAFSFAKCLRILDFSECSSILLPAYIGQLKQLRYLTAPRIQNKKLPEFVLKLSKLQYLNLLGSSQISTVPETIGKLSCLVYLGLSGCSGISKVPESVGDLKGLTHLDLSGCSGISMLPESVGDLKVLFHLDLSGCFNLGKLPEALGNLTELRYLNMSVCSQLGELPETFQNLQNLMHLDLSSCVHLKLISGALCGLTALQHLNISNLHNYKHKTHFLPSLKGLYGALRNLTNLKYLNLSHSLDMLDFEEEGIYFCLGSIHSLTNLEHLDLSENKCLVEIPENIGNLENLCTLNLSGCYRMLSLPERMRKNKLKSLLVERCSVQLIDEIRSFSFDYSLTLPLFVVRGSNADSCSNLHHLNGLNPGELNICFLENVRFHEEASAVKLSDKHNLSALTLSWTSNAHRHLKDMDLLGALVPPTGLKKLQINGYSSISFPTWLMSISDHLQNLVSVSLFSLPNCSDLPPLGQLANLEKLELQKLHRVEKISRNFCGGKGAFQHLTSFTLRDMSGLEEWDTKYSAEDCIEEFMFPVLDKLEIFKCPRLRSKPCPPIFRDCIINDSDEVIYSWDQGDIGHHTSSIPRTTLKLIKSDCLDLGLLQHLSTLQELKLFKLRYIEGLPESMRHLVSLQLVELRCCERISGLPDWLSDLASLRSITIVACLGIQSLPLCVKELTKLEKLQVEYNWKLKAWCESEENKMKLAHLTDMMFYNCEL